LNSEDDPQPKYAYRLRLEAKKSGVFDEETTKAEVQSYINELLGVKDRPRENVILSTA
jgi:hypothetical protein